MTIAVIREYTAEDKALVKAAAERFCKRHGIQLEDNKYSDDELMGLVKPPLVNGGFCIFTYRRWKTVNKLWPWDMTYEQWRGWIDKTSTPLSDNIYIRAEQQLYRLSELKHWFYTIGERIKQGYEIDPIVLEDYKNRTK